MVDINAEVAAAKAKVEAAIATDVAKAKTLWGEISSVWYAWLVVGFVIGMVLPHYL